jgi:hypothetical protein
MVTKKQISVPKPKNSENSEISSAPKARPVKIERSDRSAKQIVRWASFAAILIAAIAAAITVWVIHTNNDDRVRLQSYDNAATTVGLSYARQKCLEEGVDATICNSITGVVGRTECAGMSCWIVNTMSSDGHTYRAGVTVQRQDGHFKATGYLRDPNAH